MEDPTTDSVGAGAGSNFAGHEDAARNFRQTAGVVEGRPGIIESANIDPLNENSNKGELPLPRLHASDGADDSCVDDGWANASSTGTGIGATASTAASTAAGAAMSAANMAAGAARMAYGHAVGDEAAKQAGKEAVWGKQ